MKRIIFYLPILLLISCAEHHEGPCEGPQSDPCQNSIVGTVFLIDSTAEWLPGNTTSELKVYDSLGEEVVYETEGLGKYKQEGVIKSYELTNSCGVTKECQTYIEANAQTLLYENDKAPIPWIRITREKKFIYPVSSRQSYLDSLEDRLYIEVWTSISSSQRIGFDIQKDGILLTSIALNNTIFNNVFEVPGFEAPSENAYLYYSYEKGIIGFKYKGKLWAIR